MSRLSNTLTKEELREIHVAKMAGKVLDRARAHENRGTDRIHGSFAQARRHYAFSSIAPGNRHTGEAHEHLQDTARRARQAAA